MENRRLAVAERLVVVAGKRTEDAVADKCDVVGALEVDCILGQEVVALQKNRPVDNLEIEVGLLIGPKRIRREARALRHPVEPYGEASVVVDAVASYRHPNRRVDLDSGHLVSEELFPLEAIGDVAFLDGRPDRAETAADAGLSAI